MRTFFALAMACLAVSHAAQGQINSTQEKRGVQTVEEALRALSASRTQTTGAHGPMPASNPGEWVTPDDYPAWAVKYDVSGRVRFEVDVDETGRVSHCQVLQGSGIADLDEAACAKITERGRFVPATNDQRKPVKSTWRSTVVWRIPDDQIPAPKPGALSTSVVIEPDGIVSSCTVDKAEGAAESAAAAFCRDATRFEPVLDAAGKPQRVRLRTSLSVAIEPLPQ